MMRSSVSRRMAVVAVCDGVALAMPSGAIALSTHSATTSTRDSAGQLVATANCGPNEHIVSGGYKTSDPTPLDGAVVSRALKGHSWTVHFFASAPDMLTTYAYCQRTGRVRINERKVTAVAASSGNTNAMVRCSSRETLISGGYVFLGTRSMQGDSPTYKDFAALPDKWNVTAAFARTPATLAAFAYCEPGVIVKVRSAWSGSIPPGGRGSATASCDPGQSLLAGGYTTIPAPDWSEQNGPNLFYSASYRSAAASWTASAANYRRNYKWGSITAYAYCKPSARTRRNGGSLRALGGQISAGPFAVR